MSISIDGTGSISGISVGGLTDGCVTPSDLSQPLTLETAKSATGTSVDFTGIPSWAKRITVMFQEVSVSGTSSILIQLGTSTGFATSGYASTSTGTTASAGSTVSSTSGLIFRSTLATLTFSGHMLLSYFGSNSWVESHASSASTTASNFGGGSVTLSGTLDRVRITTVNGTDTFDAGTINIMYE